MITALAAIGQQPRLIDGLSAMNAASFTPAGVPQYGIAPGARFVLFGRDLGPEVPVEQENPDSTTIEGVSARVEVGGASIDAWVMSVSEKRIEVLLPRPVSSGAGTVTLTVNGTDLTAPIGIVEAAPGIRTRGEMGQGPAYLFDASAKEVLPANPAAAGDEVRLRTTGLGALDAATDLDSISILVGGKAVPAGAVTRHSSGYDDITFVLPAVEPGCAVPVAVARNGFVSNFGTIPVGEHGIPCHEPAIPEGADRDRILEEGARVGTISIGRDDFKVPEFFVESDSAHALFFRNQVEAAGGAFEFTPTLSFGSCTLTRVVEHDLPDVPRSYLDAGPMLMVNGPGGAREMPRESIGYHHARFGEKMVINIPGVELPPNGDLYLAPGPYTIDSAGGEDVGPFTARLEVPEPVKFTNMDRVGSDCDGYRCIERAEDLTIEWNGGDGQRVVTVQGFAYVPDSHPSAGVVFTCVEQADKGAMTVPAAILSALPATTIETGLMTFSVSPLGAGTHFSAPGLDWGRVQFVQSSVRPVEYR